MVNENKEHNNLKLKKIEPEDINFFDTVRGGKSKKIDYRISGETKDEARKKVDEMYNSLVQKYGFGLVRNVSRMINNNRDENGQIKEWVITGHFLCFIPEKIEGYNKENSIEK